MTGIHAPARPVLYRDAVWFWVLPMVLAVGLLPLTTTSYQRIAIATILGVSIVVGVVTGAKAQWRPGRPDRVSKNLRSSFLSNLAGLLVVFGCGTLVAPDSHSFWAKMAGYCGGFALSLPIVVWLRAFRARRARRET